MIAKHLIIACLAGIPALAQTSGEYQPGAIYLVHSATRHTADTAASGLAPGSLCDITITGLYQSFGGSFSPDDIVTLRLHTPGADVRDLTIIATKLNFSGFPTEFTALIPTDAPLGQAEVLAVSTSGKSYSTTLWISGSGFGIFTKSGEGSDAASANVLRAPPRTVGLTTPVHAGEWVTLWGSGLGSAAATVSVEVAGIVVSPSYSGPAPGFPGLDQINFRFPEGVPDDCYIPLAVKVGDRESNTTSIAAASAPGPCRHRLGLSSDALETLDQGGFVPLSQSFVSSVVIPDFSIPVTFTYMRNDTVSQSFFRYGAAGMQFATGLLTDEVAGCRLSLGGGYGGAAYLSTGSFLESGTPVVTGPGGVRIPMEGFPGYYHSTSPNTRSTLNSIPPSLFEPGDWTVEVPGGNDVAAFRAALRVPPALRWINRATVSPVSRTKDITLKWDPSGYTDQEWVQGSLDVGRGSVGCQAAATAGSITIPASLIAQLPDMKVFPAMLILLLAPIDRNPVVYPVPLVGGGITAGIASFGYMESIWVELK